MVALKRCVITLIKLTESVLADANIEENNAKAVFLSAEYSIAVTVGIALVLAVLIVWRFTVTLNRPLAEAVAMLNELEAGHIDQRVNFDRNDEIGTMGKLLMLLQIVYSGKWLSPCSNWPTVI